MSRASTTLPTSNPTTPTANWWTTRLEHNNQDLNEHEESCRGADSSPCFAEISNDNPEDELELQNENNAESGRLVRSKPSLSPSGTQPPNQAESPAETRKTGQEMGDDNHPTSDTTWLTTAEDCSEWDAVDSDYAADSNNQHDSRSLSPRPRQPLQNGLNQGLRLTTKTKTTLKTTTTLFSSTFNESTVEPPQHHIKHARPTMQQPGFLMTHSYWV